MKWIKLTTGKGQCYVDADRIVYISVPFSAAKYDESRHIGLGYDFTVYVLNTPDNYDALKAAKIEVGTPEEWGKPRDRKAPRLVRGKAAARVTKAQEHPEPGSRAFTTILMRLQDELEKEHKILLTGDNAFFIREAVEADPKVTAAQIAERWRAAKKASRA